MMELEEKIFKMIDEELDKLEDALIELKEDNEKIKIDIKKKEIILKEVEQFGQESM